LVEIGIGIGIGIDAGIGINTDCTSDFGLGRSAALGAIDRPASDLAPNRGEGAAPTATTKNRKISCSRHRHR
jgi:hypothetical protein